MPTLGNMDIPKPKDWQEFERLVESYARVRKYLVKSYLQLRKPFGMQQCLEVYCTFLYNILYYT